MKYLLVLLLVLPLPSCVRTVPAAPAAPAPAAPAPAAPAHPAPSTGNKLADGVSNAAPRDVVAWIMPWLAGILAVSVVGVSVVAVWLRSRSMACLAAALAVGLALVMVMKLVMWILAGMIMLALAGLIVYLFRELWQHRKELAKVDPLHRLLTRKQRASHA